MKAGAALGLLAGLGAMNAMSGNPYGGKRFTGLMDMLDGGGAGASGDKFEGGGLLSMLGNLFLKPMQAQQNIERIADNAAARNAGITDAQRNSAAMAEMERQRGLAQDVYDERGPNQMGLLSTPQVTPDAGPPMPATSMSPLMINQSLPTYDEVTPMNVGLLGGGDDLVSASSPAIDDGGEGAIFPLQTIMTDGQKEAARKQKIITDMRANMSRFSKANWDKMSRKTRRDSGLPETEIEMRVAGVDAFSSVNPPMTTGLNPPKMDFADYAAMIRRDPMMSYLTDEDIMVMYNNVFGN